MKLLCFKFFYLLPPSGLQGHKLHSSKHLWAALVAPPSHSWMDWPAGLDWCTWHCWADRDGKISGSRRSVLVRSFFHLLLFPKRWSLSTKFWLHLTSSTKWWWAKRLWFGNTACLILMKRSCPCLFRYCAGHCLPRSYQNICFRQWFSTCDVTVIMGDLRDSIPTLWPR